MKHMLMNPAFPDVVGKWADELIDDKSRVWVVTRSHDGRLCEELDPQFLSAIGAAATAEEVADVIAIAAGRMELAETRVW